MEARGPSRRTAAGDGARERRRGKRSEGIAISLTFLICLVVARRTVTKYRQALRIEAVERRRVHSLDGAA